MEELKYVEEEDPLPGAGGMRRAGDDGVQAEGGLRVGTPRRSGEGLGHLQSCDSTKAT